VADIHITRKHALGMAGARKLAFRWAEEAEEQLGLECVYEEGAATDHLKFTRAGVKGGIKVTKDHFVLDAHLGVLLGAFKDTIESKIVKNLDELLAAKDPLHAFDSGIGHGKHHAKKTASKKKA
jgi:putative polyhydroxyalkanoate system protein